MSATIDNASEVSRLTRENARLLAALEKVRTCATYASKAYASFATEHFLGNDIANGASALFSGIAGVATLAIDRPFTSTLADSVPPDGAA